MAYESQIGTYHLGENPQLYDPQRANNYEFVVTNIDGILRPGRSGTEADGVFRNAQEILRVSVSQAFVPHFTQADVPIQRGNSTIHFAGVPTFGSGSLQFHDFMGAQTKEILLAWQNLSYNVYTEKVGTLARTNYKKDCYLLEYPPDYAEPLRSWTLHGCWVSELSEDAYDNYSGDAKRINCVIIYDYATLDDTEDTTIYRV